MHLVVGEPIVKVDHLQLDQKNLIKVSGDQKYSIGKLFTSPRVTPKGTDGKVIGRINQLKNNLLNKALFSIVFLLAFIFKSTRSS